MTKGKNKIYNYKYRFTLFSYFLPDTFASKTEFPTQEQIKVNNLIKFEKRLRNPKTR